MSSINLSADSKATPKQYNSPRNTSGNLELRETERTAATQVHESGGDELSQPVINENSISFRDGACHLSSGYAVWAAPGSTMGAATPPATREKTDTSVITAEALDTEGAGHDVRGDSIYRIPHEDDTKRNAHTVTTQHTSSPYHIHGTTNQGFEPRTTAVLPASSPLKTHGTTKQGFEPHAITVLPTSSPPHTHGSTNQRFEPRTVAVPPTSASSHTNGTSNKGFDPIKPHDDGHVDAANDRLSTLMLCRGLPQPPLSASQIRGYRFLDVGHSQNGFDWFLVKRPNSAPSSSLESFLPRPEADESSSSNEHIESKNTLVVNVSSAVDNHTGGSPQKTLTLCPPVSVHGTPCIEREAAVEIWVQQQRASVTCPEPQVGGGGGGDERRQHSPAWSNDERTCRICQEGDSLERLVSPCLCSGTVGYIHVSCLNTWLQVTSRTSCELCAFPFPVTRQPAPFSEYLRNPRANMDLPNLVCDFACLLVLTPLLFSSVYLSSTGALRYETLGRAGSMCAVVTLLVALLLVYVSWACLAVLYHVRIWQAWRERHGSVSKLNEGQIANRSARKIMPVHRSMLQSATLAAAAAVAVAAASVRGSWAAPKPAAETQREGSSESVQLEQLEGDKTILLSRLNGLSGLIHIRKPNRVSAGGVDHV